MAGHGDSWLEPRPERVNLGSEVKDGARPQRPCIVRCPPMNCPEQADREMESRFVVARSSGEGRMGVTGSWVPTSFGGDEMFENWMGMAVTQPCE